MADTAKETKREKIKETKPGIVYLSRLPKFMEPSKVRYIFSQYGEVGKLFLQPEAEFVRKKRKKFGGSGRKMFTEGWVEFKDKKVAKQVALCLNNTIVGGKKKSFYHDDIWNIKYLPKFLWTQLGEQIAYEKATREQRMRTEISQARKDANLYIECVEQEKAFQAMEQRKRKHNMEVPERNLRSFKQHKVVDVDSKTLEPAEKKRKPNATNKISTKLLSKIFTSNK